MRIVLQGSMTPKQMGEAVKTVIEDTLTKAEAKGKKKVVQNPVIEFTLNVQEAEQPVLIVDDETGSMLTVHQGIENGELIEYVAPNREELVEKFDRMLAEAQEELKPDTEEVQ